MSGLSNRSNNISRPLQASTNIIHTKIPRRIGNIPESIGHNALKNVQQISHNPLKVSEHTNKEPAARKVKPKFDENAVTSFVPSQDKPAVKTPKVEQVGENDLSFLVKNAYNVLGDVHPFDEELHQKVLSLELADDGLPSCVSEEPFDF